MCIREHLVTLSGSRKELRDLVIQNCKKDYPKASMLWIICSLKAITCQEISVIRDY